MLSISSRSAAPSDIRAYLAPGVPAELTRAALRRAWLADPTIRGAAIVSTGFSTRTGVGAGTARGAGGGTFS